MREVFLQSFQYWLPEANALLSFGVLFGQIDRFPQELHEYFIDSGVIHVVAASGYNVTIVIVIISQLLQLVSFKHFRTAVTLISIIIYCLLAGGTPSVLRAGIMGALMVLGKASGRLYEASHALFITIIIMLLVSPTLIFSLSFLLSVSATIGLVLFGPQQDSIASESSKSVSLLQSGRQVLRESFWTSVAASVITIPLIIVIFGRLSLIAIVSNTILLWMIPLIMLVATIYLSMQLVHPLLGLLPLFLLWGITEIFLRSVKLFATLPFASIELTKVHWMVIPVTYTLIGAYVLVKRRSN